MSSLPSAKSENFDLKRWFHRGILEVLNPSEGQKPQIEIGCFSPHIGKKIDFGDLFSGGFTRTLLSQSTKSPRPNACPCLVNYIFPLCALPPSHLHTVLVPGSGSDPEESLDGGIIAGKGEGDRRITRK